MKYQNNATKIRRELLIRVAKAFYKGKLVEQIDKIPLEMFPKRNNKLLRCCVYKERAIIKHRIMSILGFKIEEDDELTPLSEFARKALARENFKTDEILNVLDIACSGCVKSQYLITNACRGCMARPCILNCPKNAISMINNQAVINYDLCIDCGKCMQVCPYRAIIRIPVPCEEACPVEAIGKDESGKAVINFSTCISCGQCMDACPFGAVIEKSQFIDILQILQSKKMVVAMLAPAIAGDQFKGNLKQIAAAVKQLGFARVFEVAGGADVTSEHEIKEFVERMHKGDAMMTSSCCPAYTEMVKKHIPELQSFVSTAATPMHYTAEIVKKLDSQAITIFVGPCIAKRKEALSDSLVDYVLTFEELDALFAAKGIDIGKCAEGELENRPSDEGRGFAATCGVTEALLKKTNKDAAIRTELIDGLTKQTFKQLKTYSKQPGDFNFLEVMACNGGCVGGPCAIGKLQQATRAIRKIAKNTTN
jgi:[FeFe] hydrogenase (group B1/B3)